jgi:hypothetical protein
MLAATGNGSALLSCWCAFPPLHLTAFDTGLLRCGRSTSGTFRVSSTEPFKGALAERMND